MIGENIKRLMKENGYTQKQLAIRSQCTESAISKYINNKREPSIEILKNLAISLGVTVGELISETKPRTNFDRITESEEILAKLIIDTVTKCQFNECEDCPLYEVDGCSRQEKVIEWLQKECEE